jgi:hypothetical protein
MLERVMLLTVVVAMFMGKKMMTWSVEHLPLLKWKMEIGIILKRKNQV